VTVRCGKARAYTSLEVAQPDAAPGDELPPADEDAPGEVAPDDGLPPPDEGGVGEEDVDPVPSPPPVPSDDATKPTTPGGLSRAAATTSTITLAWRASTDNVGVVGYGAYRGATRVANVTSGTSYRFTGLTCGKSYALGVEAYDAAGNTSARATLNAATATCPDPRHVSVAKGGSAQSSSCTVAACRYVKVTFSGFSSGTHTIVCRAGGDEGGFYSYTRSGASNTSSVCFYGFPGRQVWATVDGVASSKITW
jgi:hypothetical protein